MAHDSPGRLPLDRNALDGSQRELSGQIAAVLIARADTIVGDAVAASPFKGIETLDATYTRRVGQLLVELLAGTIRDRRSGAREGFVGDLHRLMLERNLSTDQLFAFAYVTERIALDELALADRTGATSEAWPIVAQLVRRASFDLLAAYAERARIEPSSPLMIDPLTTLYSRAMFEAALDKETVRASREGLALSLVMFDVDRLARINEEYGYGVGDRILERLGILVGGFFRHHDWVARYSEDAIVVLLIGTDTERAWDLAENVRRTVEERLEFVDHRSERRVHVTVSAAVVNVRVVIGAPIDPDTLVADAERILERAKAHGRNRVERVSHTSSAGQTSAS